MNHPILNRCVIGTPLGAMAAATARDAAGREALCLLEYVREGEAESGGRRAADRGEQPAGPAAVEVEAGCRAGVLGEVAAQLQAYFAGALREFDVPLALHGTEFQRRVWQSLLEIPYSETWTYAELATRTGRPRAFRAVGQANGRNPVAIIVPCHRVVACGGRLGGYSSGVWRKERLLELEGVLTPRAAVAPAAV